MIEPRILEVRTKILKKNDELARRQRERFVRAGVLVVNMVSSPGTGKTSFLKETLMRLRARGETSLQSWATSRPTTTPAGWLRAGCPSARS